MTQEQLRMQMLAGIITEGQYKAKLLKEELNMGDAIEINPNAFPDFEFPYGTKGIVMNIDKADYASDDLVYTVKLKHIDSQGDEANTLHIENSSQYNEELEEATALMKYASKDAKARDIEQSDREYIATRQKRDKLAKELFNKASYRDLSNVQKDRVNNQLT